MHKRTGWGARAGIMRRLGVVILLTSHAALLMMPAQANARLVSQEHQLHFIETEDHTICENIQVHTVYEYWALVSSTHMSTSGFPLNTMSGRYVETIYDLHSRVEILKFTQTGNLFRDVKATDNRDGTFTRVGFASGTEQMIYKGKAIDRWTGTIRYRETIDYNGTPMNEDDDTWLDFQIVSMSGGPHDELNGCAFLAG